MEDVKDVIAAEAQTNDQEESNVEIIEEEAMDIGRVQWPAYQELFNFGYGGAWGILIVVLLSVLINFCTLSVSLYLAFTLANRFKVTDGSA